MRIQGSPDTRPASCALGANRASSSQVASESCSCDYKAEMLFGKQELTEKVPKRFLLAVNQDMTSTRSSEYDTG